MQFKCNGNPHDDLEELIEKYDEEEAYWRFLEDSCGNIIDVPEKTGAAHAGVTSSEVWCDECGKHYTGSEARAKARNQQS